MFNVRSSGFDEVQGNILAFQNGALTAAVVATEEQAKKIAKQARENLSSMKDQGSGDTPLEEGIGYKNIGDQKWVVYSQPVGGGSTRSIPYFVEFGRGPLRSEKGLYFRQLGIVRKSAKATRPIPFFRNAIQEATKQTTLAIDASVKRAPGLK